MELILASQSQRRRELFQLIGLEYTCIPSDADVIGLLGGSLGIMRLF